MTRESCRLTNTSAKNPDQQLGKKAETVAEVATALPRAAVGAGRAIASALPSAERAGAAINAAAGDHARAADVAVDSRPSCNRRAASVNWRRVAA